MVKRVLIGSFVMGIMVAFLVQSAAGANPKWKEEQKAWFEQLGLKSGDIIKPADWKKVDGLLPPEMLEWLKRGDLPQLRIGEFMYDVEADDEWVNACKKNAGKFRLNEKEVLVEAATGKYPLWVYGTPFPEVDMMCDPDWKKNLASDPHGGAKYNYNRFNHAMRGSILHAPFSLEWIGPGGFERIVYCYWTQYCYWGRSDGQQSNPMKYKYLQLIGVQKPYDLSGINQLTVRHIDGRDDDFYVYIPAIRRIKKMSGANRSDPYVGSDATQDDAGGFGGLENSMIWRFLETKIGLLGIVERDAQGTNKMKGLPNGNWRVAADPTDVTAGWEVEGWKGASWIPVNLVWIPRPYVVIEATPKDPYYNSGKTIYWTDPGTGTTSYKIYRNKAGEYWKTLFILQRCLEWMGKKGYHAGGTCGYLIRDEKMNHSTLARITEYVELENPNITPANFTIERLRTLGK